MLAEVLALGRQVEGIQTQQQLRRTEASPEASSHPGWLSVTPKIQQTQAEVQASLCNAHLHHHSRPGKHFCTGVMKQNIKVI